MSKHDWGWFKTWAQNVEVRKCHECEASQMSLRRSKPQGYIILYQNSKDGTWSYAEGEPPCVPKEYPTCRGTGKV